MMKLLLDTHIFLWFISGSNQLSAIFRNSIQNPNNTVYLSVVSLWECIIKYQLGKLPLSESPEIYLPGCEILTTTLGFPDRDSSQVKQRHGKTSERKQLHILWYKSCFMNDHVK